jgi:biotin carboxylase
VTEGAPTVLVVGGGLFQLGVIRAARKLGGKVAVVDRSADAPGMALADHALAIDTADVAAVTAAARRLGVAGVVTAASDVAVGAVASVVDALGLPGVGSEVAARCRDKLATFECLQRHGLATPRALKVANIAQAEAHVAELGGYPVVVKPRSSAGGRGVWVVTGRDQLEAAIARAQSYAGPDRSVLLQQYARGLSVGAEAVFWRGELLACFVLDDQYQEGFVSPVGHSLPCTLPEATQALVRDAVARYGAALGIDHGPANFDLRLSDAGVSLIEVNMRLGGNSITEVVQLAYGVDLSAAAVSAAFARDPADLLQPICSQPAAARLILRRGDGVVRMRRQHTDCAALAGVVKLDLSVVAGERAAMRVDEWALLGRCITRADRPDAAARLAERIAFDVAAAIELEP